MWQRFWTILKFHPEIVLKCCVVIGSGNIQFGSISNGEFALTGTKEMRDMLKSATIISSGTSSGTDPDLLENPTPGDILLEDFLKPLEMSQSSLAKAIGVPPRRINEIVLGKRAVTADTDLRLARYWGVSEGFFLGLQTAFDLMEARRKLGPVLHSIVKRAA
jgi:antitoxin HigA-1